MVMKLTGYLTGLKYPHRNIDWKEEPQQTISTQKLCRICTKHLKKFTTYVPSEDDFATVKLKRQCGCLRFINTLGHRSLSVFVSKSQFDIAELNENGL